MCKTSCVGLSIDMFVVDIPGSYCYYLSHYPMLTSLKFYSVE